MVFPLIVRIFSGEAGQLLARLKRLAGLYALMGVFGLALFLFLLIALFVWSSHHVGTLWTALIFAAAAFVLLAITFVLATMAKRPPAKRADDRLQRDIASVAGVAALSNAPQIVRALRERKGLILVPVAGVGAYGFYRLLAALRGR